MSAVAIMRSGAQVSMEAPEPRMISARDLAEHMAKLCVHNGATYTFYSHAQHASILAHELALMDGPLAALYGLLHAAHKAVRLDMMPLTRSKVCRAIHEAFDLDWPVPNSIQVMMGLAHDRVEITEMRDLLQGRDEEIAAMARRGVQPLRVTIRALAWDKAHDRFLSDLRSFSTMAGLPNLPALGDLS